MGYFGKASFPPGRGKVSILAQTLGTRTVQFLILTAHFLKMSGLLC